MLYDVGRDKELSHFSLNRNPEEIVKSNKDQNGRNDYYSNVERES